ncbi:hypothetical protein RESH_01220 [Rhodopirellula europaea SH398]|uniref:Uncharacterized protein n=1 Tax=Rhodopirellula europaea SH398 TaxID=1263868 RepID=M5SPT2_9BACT|nr:hypothetical protein RESH_01220 [Rhodopirellula europaea SH398]
MFRSDSDRASKKVLTEQDLLLIWWSQIWWPVSGNRDAGYQMGLNQAV